MSNYTVKLIPSDFSYRITETQAQQAVDYLRENIKAERIEVSIYSSPAFVDCGCNLERITCPHCGAQLDFEWWGEAMEAACRDGFKSLLVRTPCCEAESSLNDLGYDFPCGFACVEFDILNPDEKLCVEHRNMVEKMIGCSMRVIHAHL